MESEKWNVFVRHRRAKFNLLPLRIRHGGVVNNFEIAERALRTGFDGGAKICDFYSVSIICPFSRLELISYPLKQFLTL